MTGIWHLKNSAAAVIWETFRATALWWSSPDKLACKVVVVLVHRAALDIQFIFTSVLNTVC